MIVWWSGMPLIVVAVFAVVSIFVFYCFIGALRGRSWDLEQQAGGRKLPWECAVEGCQTRNPGHARYCRMCGRPRKSQDI